MSKRRTRHKSTSSFLNRIDSTISETPKPIFGANLSKSFYIPDSTYGKMNSIDLTDYKRNKLHNKNIAFFRETFNQNDTSQLPFMSSLRTNLTVQNYQYNKRTEQRPFSVSMKRTMNQQIKKQIFDIKAKKSRISTSYYRWHNKSGVNTTTATQFQCSLRDYNQNMNPQEINFTNIIKPIKYQDVEMKLYDEHQIICPKQRRLFRLKNIVEGK